MLVMYFNIFHWINHGYAHSFKIGSLKFVWSDQINEMVPFASCVSTKHWCRKILAY